MKAQPARLCLRQQPVYHAEEGDRIAVCRVIIGNVGQALAVAVDRRAAPLAGGIKGKNQHDRNRL